MAASTCLKSWEAALDPLTPTLSPWGEGACYGIFTRAEEHSGVLSPPPYPLADRATPDDKLTKASLSERDRVRGDFPKPEKLSC